GRGVPAGDDDIGLGPAAGDAFDHLGDGDPPVAHDVGELVEDQQVVVARAELAAGHLPGVAVLRRRLVEVLALPGDAVTEGPPVDPEMFGELALTGVPLPALHELHDADAPAA